MRHEKSMDLEGNTSGASLYGVRHGKKSQTPQPELRQGAVCSNKHCLVRNDRSAVLCRCANGNSIMEGGARMKKYTEVYPFKVEDEVKAGIQVNVLDKCDLTTQNVNYTSYTIVLRMIDNTAGRYYFWKEEEVKEDTEAPQATTSGENEA